MQGTVRVVPFCSGIETLITSSDFRVIYLLVRDGDMLVPPSGHLWYFPCHFPKLWPQIMPMLGLHS